jgi:hypothetical protein
MWILVSASIDSSAAVTGAAAVLTAAVTALSTWQVTLWKYRREAEDKATQALRHNRDPLLRAAFDLQSRIYNIAANGFFDRYWLRGSEEERHYARCSTLWLVGQFLGWTEILRREVQFLDVGSRATNREVQRRLSDVSAAFASDSHGGANTFIVFRSDQRAIGEFMVTEHDTQSGSRPDCLGYSEFVATLNGLEGLAANSPVAAWVGRFTAEIDAIAAAAPGDGSLSRLVRVQRRLVDLIDLLDPDRLRYPRADLRGRLPWTEADSKPSDHEVARFVWPWEEPWSGVEEWAERRGLRSGSTGDGTRSYRGGRGPLGGRPELQITYERDWFTIAAWTERGGRTRSVDGTLRSRRTRLALDDLLNRYDRPLVNEASRPYRAVEWVNRGIRRLFGWQEESAR